MSEQLEIFDEIGEQTTFTVNVGASKRARRAFVSVSPQFGRAKVARPAPDSPAAAASPPAAVPEPVPEPPSVPRIITTPEDLIDLIRRRRDELGLTHETIDHLTGWASGYASKLLSPEPLKGLGERSLGLVLDALALGIARIEFVENPGQAARMRPRWTKRLRPRMRPRRTRGELSGALLDKSGGQTLGSTTEDNNVETPFELPPQG